MQESKGREEDRQQGNLTLRMLGKAEQKPNLFSKLHIKDSALGSTRDYVHPTSHRLPNKSLNTKCRKVPLKSSLFTGILENHPQTTETIVIAHGCPLELGGKTLLLRTPYTVVSGRREFKLMLIRKFLPAS